MAVLQIRVDDDLKKQAIQVFDDLGLDLSTAIRMFLKKSVSEKGIPFDITLDEKSIEFGKLIRKLQKHSEEIGNSEMTLEEINEEIRLAREERRNKEKKH